MAKKPPADNKKDEHGLTLRERTYADHLLLTGNKKQSAIAAGCSEASAPVSAARMSKNVSVMTYLATKRGGIVQKLESEYGLTLDRVLRELAACALFDPAKMYDANGGLLPVSQMDEMTRRAIAGIDVKEEIDMESGLINGYSKKVRLQPKIAALELAGRHLGMWGDKDTGGMSILNINIDVGRNQLDQPNNKPIFDNGSV